MSTYPAILTAFFIVVGAVFVWTVAVFPLAVVIGRMCNDRRHAYGPRVMYGLIERDPDESVAAVAGWDDWAAWEAEVASW